MSSNASELFKAIYIVAIGACAFGLLRLALLERLDARLKLAVGSFLVLMLLPTTYLYLRLAFPAASEAVLPFQSMAIWVYGPLLLTVLHLSSHQRMRRWHVAGYMLPLICAALLRLTFYARELPLPGWWELLSLTQALLLASLALGWTLRRRAQLRILAIGFPGSSFGVLLYLSAGLLALLLSDFFVHWRLYAGPPLSQTSFYLWVTPGALYALGISMVLIWRAGSAVHAIEDTPPLVQEPEPSVIAPELPTTPTNPRNLELSPAAAHELAPQLDALMREQRLYTRNDLTLADLATALRVSTHQASELLNAHLHVSFYELMNRHRAQEAAELLQARKGKYSIADVAYEAGFNNLNTFYKEFKRAHGVTPAQFRRSAAAVIAKADASAGVRAAH